MSDKFTPLIKVVFPAKILARFQFLMISVVSKYSTDDVRNPISLIFGGSQTLHITTIFEEILQIILIIQTKVSVKFVIASESLIRNDVKKCGENHSFLGCRSRCDCFDLQKHATPDTL